MSDNTPPRAWRYIDSGLSSGPLNMAIDEALLCSFDPNESLPIVRTYGWTPPALSLGRFQDATEVLDLDRCRHRSVDIVRRVSGGGTIYHADELTYSIVCSAGQIPSSNSVKDSFRILTGFLIEFYRMFGLRASYAVDSVSDAKQLGVRTAFCFAGKETFDIVINGRKIGGNAQRRHRNVVFQHGSIPIINRARYGLQYMKDCTPEYAGNAVSLSDCGVSADITTLKRGFVEAFRSHMGVGTILSTLSEDEQRMSSDLSLKKYASDRWNLQGEVE